MPEHLPDPAAQRGLRATPQLANDLPSLGADVTYHGYLALDRILDAQHPIAPESLGAGVHAAEHFFIVVHQVMHVPPIHRCKILGESSRDGTALGDRRVIRV